jgi:ubiquinone/menaquinone biosynthesis C-methylase UbiE
MEHEVPSDRVGREQAAHTENDVLAEAYRLKDRFPHIWSYPSRQRLFAERNAHLEAIAGKRVLDYGCGRGESSLYYLSREALVSGIDISSTYIEAARAAAKNAGYSPATWDFNVMDAHAMSFDEGTFDLVVGEGILHHLDADLAMKEIWRVLKPGGRVFLQEPLADNPLLKIFRWLTPKARTVDEEPFSGKAISRLTSPGRWVSECVYCGIVEAPVAMVTSVLMPSKPDNFLLRAADSLEKRLIRNRVLLSWNQYILLNLVKVVPT